MEAQEMGQESVVDVPVDAGQAQVNSESPIPSTQETGVTTEVAAQVTDEKDFGPALKAELARREAQLEKKYSERAQQAETYQQNLERIAKHYGFETHNDYMKALDAHEQQQRIEEEASKLGVDESVIREHLQPLKDKLSEYEKEKAALQQERTIVQIEKEVTDLKAKYPDFEKYQEKVFDLAVNSGYKLEDAYRLATYDDKLSSIAKQTEADTIKKIQQNGAAATGSLGAGGAEHKTGFAAMSKDAQRQMIEEVKQGRRTSFD